MPDTVDTETLLFLLFFFFFFLPNVFLVIMLSCLFSFLSSFPAWDMKPCQAILNQTSLAFTCHQCTNLVAALVCHSDETSATTW